MMTATFTPPTAPCSSSSVKRKRDDFSTMMSMNPSPSLLDHGQASHPPIAGMGTLSLRGETNSRTMKRFRNKPRERDVHEHTLEKLFNAQSVKNPSSAQPASSTSPAQKPSSRPTMSSVFASFFTSSKPHPKPAAKQINTLPTQSITSIPICEDCDKPLQERELYLSGGGQCINCRRIVCSEGACSVAVNDGWGGEGRVCLECALR